MIEYIKKEDLKEVIVNVINDEYVHKDKICELLIETEWSEEKDYRLRYIDFHNKLLDLVGTEYHKRYKFLN